jgi:N-acetylglucosamine malate deacetylase 1
MGTSKAPYTIMAVGAHPDDIEIGCGGTIHKLIADGHRVVCVDLTDGEATPKGTRDIRRKEMEAANRILGIRERICLGLPNRVLMDNEASRRLLAAEMRRTPPDLVLAHADRDAHPDHLAANAITRGAVLLSRIVKIDLPYEPFRPRRVIHFLSSHLRYPFQPSFIIPVSPEGFKAKLAAILKYESQFLVNRDNAEVAEWLATRMRYYGELVRQQYGEAYISEEPIAVTEISSLLGGD